MNSSQEYDKKSNIFSVKEFGAVGDGLQDDTLAITKAIDETYKNGGILLFPSGTYIISSDIELKREFISTGAVSFKAPDNGDLSPSVVFYIGRRMNVSNVTFNNLVVKLAPKDNEQIYTPVALNGVNFLHSSLQIGQSRR